VASGALVWTVTGTGATFGESSPVLGFNDSTVIVGGDATSQRVHVVRVWASASSFFMDLCALHEFL
jgi:hypothetical protein